MQNTALQSLTCTNGVFPGVDGHRSGVNACAAVRRDPKRFASMVKVLPSHTILKLSEPQGRLLALMVRQQPVTAYQLFRIHEQSPAGSINASKGQVYPAIASLKARGFVKARAVKGDRRN